MSAAPAERNSPEDAKIMRGWELYEYGGIDSLTFIENILLPQIKSPTDVLVEVIATSVNPLDQLQTGQYMMCYVRSVFVLDSNEI